MPQGHQDCQLDCNCSQHERTYQLSRQECHKGIKTVSLIPTAASMTGPTNCQGKNAKGIKTVSLIPTAASMRTLTHCQGKNATSQEYTMSVRHDGIITEFVTEQDKSYSISIV